MKFNLVKKGNGWSEYESENGSISLKFFKTAKSVVMENKENGELFCLLYEELAELVVLKNENE